MSKKSVEMPKLMELNPILLWMFGHGVEDIDWGKRSIDQHTLAVTIHELAGRINDVEMRKQIQSSAAKLLLNTVQDIIKESHSDSQCM